MICANCGNKIQGHKVTISKNGKKIYFDEQCYNSIAKPSKNNLSEIEKKNHIEWLTSKHKEFINAVSEPA